MVVFKFYTCNDTFAIDVEKHTEKLVKGWAGESTRGSQTPHTLEST